MVKSVQIYHIALQCDEKNKAMVFYQQVLGLNLTKSFKLSRELTKEIFDIDKGTEVLVFQDSNVYIEVFIMQNIQNRSCNHIGLIIYNLKEFIEVCNHHHITCFSVKKGEKIIWFVKDFSDNIFEIKERS
jgi:predicted enzyme related to lactoylglutathione lyase